MRSATISAALLLAGLAAHARPAAAQASQCATVSGNLVANCGFETGSFGGYAAGGNATLSGVSADAAHSGADGAYLGGRGSAITLTQTLATTPGAQYAFNFFLLSEDFGLPGTAYFRAYFGGRQVLDVEGQAPSGFTPYSFAAIATGASTDVRFVAQNDPSFFDLDDVSVAPAATTVPEPAGAALVGAGLLALGAVRRRGGARRGA